jgi:O-antigen/teichoic acid export membrane protein
VTKNSQSLVLRNALLLVVGQALAMPLSIVVNAVVGRYIGAAEFGYLYVASTYMTFGFLFVDWGQNGTLPALVAKDRSRAGEFLGSGLAWRTALAPVAYLVIAAGCFALGYPRAIQLALALIALTQLVGSAIAACQDTVRGFERTDIAARSLVAQQVLTVLLIVPVLLAGGRLPSVLATGAVVGVLMLVFVASFLRPVGVGALLVRAATVRLLLAKGWPFLVLGATMALQPAVDALFLSKLVPYEVVGWHAAARKLLGVLVYPASALISALYPTLCRLYGVDQAGFRDTASSALRTSAVLVAPLALGTALYAEPAIRIFGAKAFGPAADNLRLYSPFIALVYFSMPLGSGLLAAGRQRAWAAAQLGCVVVSVALDPILVPLLQARTGNGGLGVCLATLASEILMVGAGLWLSPKGVLDGRLGRALLRVAVASGAMFAAARGLSGVNPYAAAPVAVAAYFLSLWAVGGIEKDQVDTLRGMISRKAGRA